MKASFNKVLAALFVSAGLMTSAHADSTQYVPLGAVGSTTTFSGTIGDTLSSLGTFTDIFGFSGAPASSDISISATAGAGITFTSLTLEYFGGSTPIPLDLSSVSSGSLQATAYDQISGFYQWVITGTVTTAGASYTGTILENTNVTIPSAVPEPSSWALMLGGLGLVGMLSRKRLNARRG